MEGYVIVASDGETADSYWSGSAMVASSGGAKIYTAKEDAKYDLAQLVSTFLDKDLTVKPVTVAVTFA